MCINQKITMSGQVKFSYQSDYNFTGSSGYSPEPLDKVNIEFTIPHTDLCVGQYTELFKSFLLAVGFDKDQILGGCLSLALSEEHPKELTDKLMEEFEIQDKLPEYLSIEDEELLLQVLNPTTDTDKDLVELSNHLRPVVSLIREYNANRSKKVDEILSQVERDGWIDKEKRNPYVLEEPDGLLKKEVTKKTLQKAYCVCSDCGNKYGTYISGVSSWWQDECDVCGKSAPVTETRDFGYLDKGIKELGGKK